MNFLKILFSFCELQDLSWHQQIIYVLKLCSYTSTRIFTQITHHLCNFYMVNQQLLNKTDLTHYTKMQQCISITIFNLFFLQVLCIMLVVSAVSRLATLNLVVLVKWMVASAQMARLVVFCISENFILLKRAFMYTSIYLYLIFGIMNFLCT